MARKKKSKGRKTICYMMRCTKAGKPSKHGGHKKKVCRRVKRGRKRR